jgi:hypothetical protein
MELFEKVDSVAHYNYQDSNGGPLKFVKIRGGCWGPTGPHFKMYTYHSTLRYLVNKPVLGMRICRWLLLFQEYDFIFIVKLGKLNAGPYHFSWILIGEDAGNLDGSLPNA